MLVELSVFEENVGFCPRRPGAETVPVDFPPWEACLPPGQFPGFHSREPNILQTSSVSILSKIGLNGRKTK